MATITLNTEEYEALVAERNTLRGESDGLSGEVRTLKVKVSLLEERLKAHLRQLFDAKSEARGTDQKDLFFNEAEALAPSGTPVAEDMAEVETWTHEGSLGDYQSDQSTGRGGLTDTGQPFLPGQVFLDPLFQRGDIRPEVGLRSSTCTVS